MKQTLRARGHENVTAAHASTLELTTEDWLTPAGDCIVGVAADHAPADLDDAFVDACRDADARIVVDLATADHATRIIARGHPDLTFTSDRGAVVRTSSHVDDRTVAVDADRAAADLPRDLVGALADGDPLSATLTVD